MDDNPGRALTGTFQRELLSHRVNRFLHVHVALMFAIGASALLAPPEAAQSASAWWILNGLLYVGSLSTLMIGLSSGQSEREEFAVLFSHPVRTRTWVAGKCLGLSTVVLPATGLLILPTWICAGFSNLLLVAAVCAAAISLLMAWIGLALGLAIVDPVRGLIATLGLWCVLLFGVDLALIAVGGSEWIQAHPAAWVSALMLSPLDAYRVTMLFTVEGAAFGSAALHPLTAWWIENALVWLGVCVAGWCGLAWCAAIRAVRRQRLV